MAPYPHAEAEASYTLGMALAGQARFQEAALYLQEAVRLRPDYPDAHNNLGHVWRQLGRLPHAEGSFREVLRLRPDLAPAHYNLGLALADQGRLEEALAEYQEALRLRPDLAEAHNNLGNVALQQGRFEDAERSFHEALRLRPEYAEAWYNLGLTWLEQERLAESCAAFQEALRLRPEFPEAHNKRGAAVYAAGKYEEAAACYQQALRLQPTLAEAHCNLAIARCKLGRFAEAEAGVRQVLSRLHHHPNIHYVLSYALWELGRLDEAAAACAEAIRCKPDYPDPHHLRGLCRLLHGNFADGWVDYEWRWKIKEFGHRPLPPPHWDGSRLEGKTILLLAEQGLGDTLQFIRYAPLVKQRGGRVLVWTFSPLASLLRTCPGVDLVVNGEEPLPRADVHAYLLSLPLLFGTSLSTIPANVPYLSADPDLVTQWRQKLGAFAGWKVGIVWRGSPGHKQDRLRSVSLSQFAPLARVTGVRLFSLQVGAGREELANQKDFTVIDLGGSFDPTSFADAAAVVRNLDLVVTVDTALAHLAGALGVPVWVALPFHPDWRWLLGREDSPWYPSMRLFRQPRPGQWPPVFQRIAAELTRLTVRNSFPQQ